MKFVCLFIIITLVTIPAMAQTPSTPDTTQKAAATEKPGQTISATKIAFCTGVENRDPVGEASEFAPSVGKLYCWSDIANTGEATTITHVWYFNDNEMGRVELPIKYPRNRVWSSKTIYENSAGAWRVDILDSNGDKITEKACILK